MRIQSHGALVDLTNCKRSNIIDHKDTSTNDDDWDTLLHCAYLARITFVYQKEIEYIK